MYGIWRWMRWVYIKRNNWNNFIYNNKNTGEIKHTSHCKTRTFIVWQYYYLEKYNITHDTAVYINLSMIIQKEGHKLKYVLKTYKKITIGAKIWIQINHNNIIKVGFSFDCVHSLL